MRSHKIFLVNGKQIPLPFKRVLVAKTTHLGDLVISLPMATALKERDPTCTVIFLTSEKTVDVARCCPDIDEVYAQPATAEELEVLLASLRVDIFIQVNSCRVLANAAYRARIPIRIGSLFRFYNLRRCTHLVALSRFRRLNKRLLDLQYLLPLGIRIEDEHAIAEMYDLHPPGISPELSAIHPDRFARGRRKIILSPSMTTARSHQWPLASYTRLIHSLDPSEFHWFICGAASDRDNLRPLLESHSLDRNVTDLVGRLSMTEFMSFITCCDALVAGSTGPLHLAAAQGIRTLGLYQSRKVDRERWRPIGPLTSIIHSDVRCQGERRIAAGDLGFTCPCIAAINPERVAHQLLMWFETSCPPASTEARATEVGPGADLS
jgi:ADP-heptose:LPS heptosyltransferase